MKKSILSCLLFILILPFPVFSQWMILDTLCKNDPYAWPKKYCNDWFMTKPDVGYVGYSLIEMWQTPHSAEVAVSYIGSSRLFYQQCIAAGNASLSITNLRFINDTVGFFNKNGNFECSYAVYRTVNGNDFSLINIQLPGLTTFTSANTGYFLNRDGYFNHSGILTRYRNGVIENLKSFPGYPVFNSLYFINDSVGFFSCDQSFQKSSDWGQTWIPIDTVTGKVTSIYFPSPLVGYIIKNGTSLLKTTDGGNTWTFLSTHPTLNSMDFLNDSIGYAVGNNGLILYTTNGGQSWVVQPSPVTGELFRVQFVAPSVGFINYGSIRIRTINDGSPDLSMVSYDSVTHKNQIIWQKGVNFPNRFSPITHYHIFRELSAGTFTRIGELAYAQSGVFLDTLSNPSIKAEKYTLTSVDSSGYESPKSPPQQTMFLKVEGAGGAGYQLNWTPWTGSSVASYIIYQKTENGSWIKLDSVGPAVNIYSLAGYQTTKAKYLIQAMSGNSSSSPDCTIGKPISNIVDYLPVGKVTPPNQDVTAMAGTASFLVTAYNDWTAESDVPWCAVTPSGTGNGTLQANYTENNSSTARIAHIEIKSPDFLYGVQTVTVTQSKSSIGFEDNTVDVLQIYPNPGNGLFRISLGNIKKAPWVLTVRDLNGKVIYFRQYQVLRECEIDLSKAPQGCYQIILKSVERVLVRKLIIIR